MIPDARPSRRGVALLLVLAALVLVVTACAALAAAASTLKIRRGFDADARVALDLLRAAEDPIRRWLAESSESVALPPDSTEPRVEVLHDAWRVGNHEHELRITAWDQHGMVPFDLARSSSPLRLALPDEVLDAADEVQVARGAALGLDLFEGATPAGARLYPRPAASNALWFGEDRAEDRELSEEDDGGGPAVGACVATHNAGAINVNTAPMALVEHALRIAGRGGIELIEQARAEGRPANPASAVGRDRGLRSAVRIAATSTAWAFRIDVRAGRTNSSWWAVYERDRSGWRCAQRLAIPQ